MQPIRTYFFITFLACLALDAALAYGVAYLLEGASPLHFRPNAPLLWLGAFVVSAHAFFCAWTRDDDSLGSYPFLRSLIIVGLTVVAVFLFDAAYLGWVLADKAGALVSDGSAWGFVSVWTTYAAYAGKAVWVLALQVSVALFSGSIPMSLKISQAALLGAAWFWTLLILHMLRIVRLKELAHIGRPEKPSL